MDDLGIPYFWKQPYIWLIFFRSSVVLSISEPWCTCIATSSSGGFWLRFPRRQVGRFGSCLFLCLGVVGSMFGVVGFDESSEILEKYNTLAKTQTADGSMGRWFGPVGSMNQTAAAFGSKFHFRQMSHLQMKKINRLKEFQHANNAQRHDNWFWFFQK